MKPTIVFALVSSALAACGGSAGRADITPGTLPEGGNFHGVFSSVQYGEMHLCQTGAQIVGEFQKNERVGTIQGTIQGDVLRFQWEESRELVPGRPMRTRGHGYFRYVIQEDNNHYLLGEWGVDDAEIGGGPWRAVRLRGNRRPRCNATDTNQANPTPPAYEGYDGNSSGGESGDGPADPDDGLGGLDAL